ncbi:MAG TPA: hypothetical protein VL371_22670 [Gemmataceae bacterium]|jgi:hypothetical protein|nr:hypothetical protein [Gemmataceae bacterium]
MNVTKLGKWLVFINLTLSLIFLAWAIGLYTNQVHWNTPPSDGGQKIQGMIEELNGEIKQLAAARDAAEDRWNSGTALVRALETERPQRNLYYATLLRSARLGDVPQIRPPVQQLEIAPNGGVVLKLNGRPPYLIDGQPALSVAGYNNAHKERAAQIDEAHKQVTAIIGETEKLTRQINGVDPPGGGERVTAEQKGLRVVLATEQGVASKLRLEQEYLRSPITNFMIDTQLLQKRSTALKNRLGEVGSPAELGRRN